MEQVKDCTLCFLRGRRQKFLNYYVSYPESCLNLSKRRRPDEMQVFLFIAELVEAVPIDIVSLDAKSHASKRPGFLQPGNHQFSISYQ